MGGDRFKILVLEDEYLIAEDLKTMLGKAGYEEVVLCFDAQDATRVIQKGDIDFAILDVNTGEELGGLEVSTKVSQRKIPYIFLTSYADDDLLNKIKKNKPAGYLIKPTSEKELKSTIEIARYKAAYKNMSMTEKERKFLLELNAAINHVGDSDAFFSAIISALGELVDLDRPPHLALLTEDEKHVTIKLDTAFSTIEPEIVRHIKDEIKKFNPIPVSDALRRVLDRDEPAIYSLEELKNLFINKHAHDVLEGTEIKECIIAPLKVNSRTLGYLNIPSARKDHFGSAHFDILRAAANQIAVILQSNLFYEKLRKHSDKVEQENSYLLDEIRLDRFNHDFVGTSPNIAELKEKILQVAKIDTTVLIVGETGTGKELVARSIHTNSSTSNKPMVKINCASLPAQLIESELFGHEKGSFTGAEKRVIGKFEMANNGIIFLDEIGELPLDLQPKLLRVIQEKEIVRIGGTDPIELNVKIIAATNRNLVEQVEEGKFREDLFYRLNVFPINIPPLRERREEIEELANYFLTNFSKKLGKPNLEFTPSTLSSLVAYDWPGNIRELQHVIEKHVILAKNKEVEITIDGRIKKKESLQTRLLDLELPYPTLQQSEKNLIINVLHSTNGKVRGSGGAAEILDINPSTLESKIKKLGIIKRQLFESLN